MAEWIKYDGSIIQIAEMRNCENGFILRSSDHMYEHQIIYSDDDFSCIDTFNVSNYLICNPHPLADMICQQAMTGQPVYVKKYLDSFEYSTITPDWNIPGAEYSFTPFRIDATTLPPIFTL